MPREKRRSEYEDYTEKLIPARVTITRQRGSIFFVFEIAGFRGAETGQIYYKGKDVLELERSLDSGEAIRAQVFNKLGHVLNFETPQTMISSLSTGTASIVVPEIFRPRSTRLLLVPSTAATR